MKNAQRWRPNRCIFSNGRLRPSSDRHEVGVASRLAYGAILDYYAVAFRRYAKGRLADLGCGQVPFYEAYRPYVEENVCVDWGRSLHSCAYWDCVSDLNDELPFADGEFDTIVLSSVLEHIANPALLWQEMARILRQGGHIIMDVPYYYWIHEPPHDYYRFTEFALRRFCHDNGLHVVELTITGGMPEILFDLVSKGLVRIPGLGNLTAAIVQSLGMLAIRMWPLAGISQRTRSLFPLGYFLVARKDSSLEPVNLPDRPTA